MAEAVRGGEISPFLCDERETKRHRERERERERKLSDYLETQPFNGLWELGLDIFRFTLLLSTFFFFFPIFVASFLFFINKLFFLNENRDDNGMNGVANLQFYPFFCVCSHLKMLLLNSHSQFILILLVNILLLQYIFIIKKLSLYYYLI